MRNYISATTNRKTSKLTKETNIANNKTPKVSVIMPIFRHSKEQLTSAIQSILNQTFSDFEFIIIDGTQDSKNADIISTLQDKRIKYLKTKGYINCLNLGVKEAKGEYVARMDSDDISYPTRIEEQVKFLDDNPDISLCSCLVEYFGKEKGISTHKSEVTLLNIIKNLEFKHVAMMFRKSINLQYEHIKPAEDCLLFKKLLLEGHKFAIIDKVLHKNYVSANSIMKKYPNYCEILGSRINIWSLAKYYNYNLSFEDKILFSKSFSKEEIEEFIGLISFLNKKLKHTDINSNKFCLHFLLYAIHKCKNTPHQLKNTLFWRVICELNKFYLLKEALKFIFTIENKYTAGTKRKVISVFGKKLILKTSSHVQAPTKVNV